ncbi:zinc finger protein 19-like [Armigeres subalbatus]|uniref:zinc finger protein 19-like n=1 Tax=Armigeres subalbatus TaxID=124917 RepID=UPI002ED45876
MDINKPKKRPRSRRIRCRICQVDCEPNKLLWNRDFREKLQDIACMWVKITPGKEKYHVCSSCQREVEVYHAFKKRTRQFLQGDVASTKIEIDDDYQSELLLNSLLQNCSEEVTLPLNTTEGTTSLVNDSSKKDNSRQTASKNSESLPVQPPPSDTEDIEFLQEPDAESTIVEILTTEEIQPEDNADECQMDKTAKKIRPYRRKFRQTDEEKAMSQEEYQRYYKKMLMSDMKKVCDICGKSINPQRMESHMNRHKGVEPYSCEECGLRFHCIANLRKHINRSHASGQNITCEICSRVSISRIAYKQHLRAAHSEKKFQCSLCHVKTITQHALDRHMDIHNQRRDFVCPQCGKSFYRKHVLNIHLRTHSGETPYKCHVCEEAFVHRRIYVMHMKKCHPDEPLMQVDRLRALKEVLMKKDIGLG